MRISVLTILWILLTFPAFSQDATTLITNANKALQARDYAKAFEQYEAAMKNLGDIQVDASINYNIGFAAFHAGRYDNAIQYFQKAIAAKVSVPQSYEFIGNSYAGLNKFDEATTAYLKAIETGAKEKGNIYYNAGVVTYQDNKYEQAVELFTLAIKENYEHPANAYLNKSIALNRLGKNDENKQTLIEASLIYPSNSNIAKALANAYISEANGRYRNGADILKTAGEKVTNGTIRTTDSIYTVEVNKAKTEFKSAIEILEKAKVLDSLNVNVNNLINACKTALK